jgi:ATP-dependent helicase/nuclease subunit B
MRTIEGHHDFGVLENRLEALIREVHASDLAGALAPMAIVVPTRRLLAALRLELAGRFPGLANVHLYHHDALAHAAAAAAGVPLPRTAPERVLRLVLGCVLRGAEGRVAEHAEARPGSVMALASTFDDLREAGVEAATALRVRDLTPRGAEVLRLYGVYEAALADLRRAGLLDRAGVLRAALPHVPDFARRFRLVVHYGAYELIGANLDLMRAAESSGVRVVYLVPWHAGGPAFERSRRFWPEVAGAPPSEIGDPGTTRLFGPRLPCLYDEAGGVEAATAPQAFAAFHAQGAAAELREVSLRLLALHRDHGLPLARMAVIARTLEPYAPLLAPTFEACGLPFSSSASLGALRDARVQAALHLARALLLDFERQPLMDFLRGGLARLDGGDPSPRAHAWDRLSRDWQVTGGVEAWTEDLPRWLRSWEPRIPEDADEAIRRRLNDLAHLRRRQASELARAVETLRRFARPARRARDWPAWADALESACGGLIAGFHPAGGEPAADAGSAVVRAVLDEARLLADARVPFSGPAALAFFESALAEATIPLGAVGGEAGAAGDDNGGVRVLDAMQARGLGFDAVFLIGFNADLVPRRPREDPFLGDGDRRRLREALAAPIPLPLAGREEERLLLAHMLGAARRFLTVSWQRADESGRARVPSPALREIARLALGAADPGRLEDLAVRVPGHPAQAGRDAALRHALLAPAEARLQVALEQGHRALGRDMAALLPGGLMPEAPERLAAGLGMLDVVEDGSAGERAYDGLVGPVLPPSSWSPSRLETLGACPQHYFFRHLLRVEELAEAPAAHEVDRMEMGLLVHRTLQDVFAGLRREGLRPGAGGDTRDVVARALELLEPAWSDATGRLAARLRPRHPLLWDLTASSWLGALRAFLARDVGALAAAAASLVGLERETRAPLATGRAGPILDLRGRLDRITRTADGTVVVSDYKTAGDLEAQVSPAEILKGSRLQLPLYALMAESLLPEISAPGTKVRSEILGVGPAYEREGPTADEVPRRAELDPEEMERGREGLLETLAVLARLAAAGFYPLNRESRLCRSCPFTRACRRRHPPTLERLRAEPAGADYFLLRGKSTRGRTLKEVRARAAREEGA